MQSYILNIGIGQTRAFNLQANMFVYESGLASPNGSDTRIRVKPDTGAEIVLRPGQRFRLTPGETATHWEVTPLDAAAAILGSVIIGSGEFEDSNVLGSVTVNAGLPSDIRIVNTYNTVLSANQAYTSGVPVQVIAPASNTNGVVVVQADIEGQSGMNVSLLAKATAPAGVIDGDLLVYAARPATGSQITSLRQPIKLAAGKGLWLYSAGTSSGLVSVLANVL